MFIKQLSIFVENKFGRLEAIVDALSTKGVNMRALSLAETTNFGILRLITDDNEKAKEILSEIGVVAKLTDVIAVYIDDKTGGLAKILKTLTEEKVSVEYMYAFLSKVEGKALMVLKSDNDASCEKALTSHGLKLLDPKEL